MVEIVSDSSVQKDTQRLPSAWFAVGLQEYWLADARGESLLFTTHRRGEEVFGRRFRLERDRDDLNYWTYGLLVR